MRTGPGRPSDVGERWVNWAAVFRKDGKA